MNYREQLQAQLDEIRRLRILSERNLAHLGNTKLLPIEVLERKGKYSYYIKEGSNRRYMSGEKLDRVRRILQKKYDIEADKKLKKIEKQLSSFLDNYNDRELYDLYDRLSPGRRQMITPIVETDETFIASWYEMHPGVQNSYFDMGDYKTIRGEYVRSKSEKIIADLLYQNNIPYQYEAMVELKNNTVYQDFTILDMNTKKTVYWEHLGLVSDIDYATKNFYKTAEYEEAGYIIGKDLIITQESLENPLNIKLVEKKMQEFIYENNNETRP